MKSLIVCLIALMSSPAFAASNDARCENYEAEQIAQEALLKENLSCLSVAGAKKCFVQLGHAEQDKGTKDLIAIPYFSTTDNGYLANSGIVLVAKNSCEVQSIQQLSDYAEPIRVIEAK